MQTDDDAQAETALTPLHPHQVHVLRIRGAIAAAPIVVAALAADLGPLRTTPLPFGVAVGAVLLIACAALLWLPPRRYRAWGYREGEDELHIRSGLWIRVATVVPFGRVQHIDIAHGPVERRFGLATLVLHTAGTRGAAVPLPGLPEGEAERMRDRIRVKIRQDLA